MRIPLLMFAAMLLFWACIPLNSPQGGSGNNVYVANYFFTPVQDTATANQKDSVIVTFRWADTASNVGHRIVWDSLIGGKDSVIPGNNPLQFSGIYEVGLSLGRYYYHCSIHGGATNDFGMDGQIVVVPFDFQPPTTARVSDPKPSPVPALVTQPGPGVAQESPRRGARQSQPAAS